MPAGPYAPTPGAGPGESKRPGYKHASELLRDGGFPAYAIRTGTMVMGAESGYNPTAHNYCCHGLMQVNVLVHTGNHGIPADKEEAIKWLYVPQNNVKAAYSIWKAAGKSWQPWEGYTNGRYRGFSGQDPLIKADEQTGIGGAVDDVTGAISDVVSPFTDVVDAATHVLTALLNPSTWMRLGKGALGGVLLVVGTGAVVFVVANKAAGSNVGKVASDVIPAGKAIKAVKKVT